MNLDLFKYSLKTNRNLIIFLMVIDFVFVPMFVIIGSWNLQADLIGILFFVQAIFLPAILLYQVNSKKGNDFYFGLPLSRKEYYFTILLFGALLILAPMIINTSFAIIFEIITDNIESIVILRIFLAIIVGLVSYVFSYAIFLKFYSTIDGIVGIISYIILPIIILFTVVFVLNANMNTDGYYVGFILAGLVKYIPFLPYTLNVFSGINSDINTIMYLLHAVYLLFYLFISIYSIYHDVSKRKSEYAEQISGHPLAYPLIINVIMICILFIIVSSSINDIFTLILFVGVGFVLYNIMQFVYRRSLKITKKNVVSFICLLLCVGIVNLIVVKSESFGAASYYKHIKNYKYTDITLEYTKDDQDVLRINLFSQDLDNTPWLIELQEDLINKSNISGNDDQYVWINLYTSNNYIRYSTVGYYENMAYSPDNKNLKNNLQELFKQLDDDKEFIIELNYEQVPILNDEQAINFIMDFINN